MIIQLDSNCSPQEQGRIEDAIRAIAYSFTHVRTQFSHYLVCIGKTAFDPRSIGDLSGIKDIHRVSDAYKLVSAKWKIGKTAIAVDPDMHIGNGAFEIMAGPCSIESEAQIQATIDHLVANDVRIMRGGVYKPRSSPYSFRGLGIDGLKLWAKLCSASGIRIITEVMQVSQIEAMHNFVDIYQVGARNSQNFNLLDALGEVDKPVLLKRGISGTINELLQAAEYIFSNGNERIMLCERGIRSFESAYRNTLDLNAVALLQEKTHLPVIVDPSHGIGIRRLVPKMALAAVMAGADGLLMEVHPDPEKAFSDGQQTLDFRQAEAVYDAVRKSRQTLLELSF